MPSVLLLLLLLIFTSPTFVYSSIPRRALHHPFFPLLNIPSPNDDFAPPPPTPSPPPFFPSFPSPPPPPPAPPKLPSFPTVPVNLSSITTAPSHTRATRYTPRRLAPLIALPAAALAVLLFTLAFLLVHHRRRRLGGAGDCDSHCFFPPNSTASDGRKLSAAPDGRKLSTASSSPAAAASEFLYLGTVVSSRAPAAAASGGGGDTPNDSPYHKLSSPELRPLPPLARHVRRYSSDEEFYSPSGIGSPAADPDASSSCKDFPAAVVGESVSPVSTLSSPSRRSSNIATSPSPASSPQISSSPRLSNAILPSLGGNVFIPPPPLAPPRVLRPLTPSPPKRNPFAVNMLAKGGKGPPPPPMLPPRPIGAKNMINNSNVGENGDDKPRTKLKPLHWDKVHASSDGTMVWDHLRSSSFELNEEMIATLFVYDSANAVAKDASKRQFKASPSQDSMVLDPKKSQNIAILLRALNVTKEEVCGALLEGNTDSLGNELLETLLKMTPNKEEECQLIEYKNDSPFKLGPAEKFLKAVLDVPFAFKRADAMLYIANFEPDVNYLWTSFGTLEAACEELRTSRLFLKLLEAVLKTGNRMNVGTNRGDAEAFKLDTLLKLVDVKGADGKTTLLHFVVQEITKAEGLKANSGSLRDDLESRKLGLQVVAGLGNELSNVKRAASMDSDVLSSYVTKLANGIEKIIEVLRLNGSLSLSEQNQRFHDTMSTFLTKAEAEIAKLQARERTSIGLVKELTVYFQGDSGKEEGHPLRTFMVVRDFLFILDKVCKEVGRINERAAVSTAHVSMAVNPSHLSVFPKLHKLRCGSSDDDDSSCSSTT